MKHYRQCVQRTATIQLDGKLENLISCPSNCQLSKLTEKQIALFLFHKLHEIGELKPFWKLTSSWCHLSIVRQLLSSLSDCMFTWLLMTWLYQGCIALCVYCVGMIFDNYPYLGLLIISFLIDERAPSAPITNWASTSTVLPSELPTTM